MARSSLSRIPVIIAMTAVGLSSVGCSGNATGHSTENDRKKTSVHQVDPQVLNDTVSAIFPVPGAEQRRTIRVFNFIDNTAVDACYSGTKKDLNDTTNRIDQAHYADLKLISEKGLTELDTELASAESRPEGDSCSSKGLPHFDEWYSLSSDWFDVSKGAVTSSKVTATLPETSRCLATKSDLKVDSSDPTSTFLSAVDYALSSTQSEADLRSLHMKYSKIYVECTEDYFSAMHAELTKRRELLIERHRETLIAFAQDLVAAGYTP